MSFIQTFNFHFYKHSASNQDLPALSDQIGKQPNGLHDLPEIFIKEGLLLPWPLCQRGLVFFQQLFDIFPKLRIVQRKAGHREIRLEELKEILRKNFLSVKRGIGHMHDLVINILKNDSLVRFFQHGKGLLDEFCKIHFLTIRDDY